MNDFINFIFNGQRQDGNRPYNVGRKAQYQDILQAHPGYEIERSDIEKGNKILLPMSIINSIGQSEIPHPIIFQILNTYNNKRTFVGVLEFVAPEGHCYLPFWMFQMLELFEGCNVSINLVTDMPKGRSVKIQPHETAFIDLPDPKTVLEIEFRNHLCFHKGDTIQVEFMRRQYKIDIVEVTAQSQQNKYDAVIILESDIELLFAEPLDYNQIIKKQQEEQIQQEQIKNINQSKIDQGNQQNQAIINIPFQGNSIRIDGKKLTEQDKKKLFEDDLKKQQTEEDYDPRKFRLINGLRQNQTRQFEGENISLKDALKIQQQIQKQKK